MFVHKNYPCSIDKGSKHVNARRFFSVDRMAKMELRNIYCTTEKIIVDYSTKPTQYSAFEFKRNSIQGIKK